jgi:hypothetical protein
VKKECGTIRETEVGAEVQMLEDMLEEQWLQESFGLSGIDEVLEDLGSFQWWPKKLLGKLQRR